MLIRTKLLLLALLPAPVLLLGGGIAVHNARAQWQAAEQTAAALRLVDQLNALSRQLDAERDAAAAAASAEARGLEALLFGELGDVPAPAAPAPRATTPPPLAVAGLAETVRKGAQTLAMRLQELQGSRSSTRNLYGTLERYAGVQQALGAIPDLAGASAGSTELARDLRALAIAVRLQDALALERIYVRHAILTNTLPPELRREFTATRGIADAETRLLGEVFGDEASRSTLAGALAAASAAGRERALKEVRGYTLRQDRLGVLYRTLGYGGLRFHFMNFLLRGDDRSRAGFHAQAAAATGVIEQLRADGILSSAELDDLHTVAAVIQAYQDTLPQLAGLGQQGLPAAQIDRRLQIDDAPALAALERLAAFRSAISAADWDALSHQLLQALGRLRGELTQQIGAQVHRELQLRRRQMWATTLATALTLLLLAAVATPLYRRMSTGIRLLAQEFERLVRTGDVLPRQVVVGSDELSQINQAVVAIGQRLDTVAQAADRMAAGDLGSAPAPLSDADRLAHAMAALAASARVVVEQAQAISAGNYDIAVPPRGEQDSLAFALTHMARALSRFRDDMRQSQWLSDGQLAVLESMNNADQIEPLAQRVLGALSGRCGAPLGLVYFVQPEGLRAVATQATAADVDLALRLEPHDGLVGRALHARRSECLAPLPRGYLRLKSGLGGADLAAVTLTPLFARGEPVGVLELGWLTPPEARLLALLDAVAEPVGLALAAADARTRTETLLQETRQQAELLREQQEELQQSNEELEQQTQMLRQSEEELKAQREQLQHTAQELTQATRYKSEFLANMSHELRTPLNSLLILSKSLMSNEDGNLTAEQVQSAQVIHQGGRDLLNLINDILDLSKVEAGRLDIHPQALRLGDLVDSLRRQFQPVATEKQLDLSFQTAADVPEEIVSDRQRVEQILRNLLSNALKFTVRGHVRLHIERAAAAGTPARPMLAFTVEDSGIGVAADKLELIFQAFQQADGSTSRKYGGTGLGLAIARQFATLLGGSLHASSQVGEGSRFTLRLPERLESAPQQRPAEAFALPPAPPEMLADGAARDLAPAGVVPDDRADLGAGERSILVIEDDLDFAAIVRNVVRQRGYKCIVATDGNSGLQLARRYLPCGIILDLSLPDIDGRRLLDILKWSPATRHIPVHIISVHEAAPETLKLGAIGFLHKPAELSDLLQVIDRIEAKLARDQRTVLVVESDPASQASIEALLRNERTQVEIAGSAAAALELLRRGPVDCIVLDLTLPDSDGLQLLEQLRRDQQEGHPPVVVYTARQLSTEEHRHLAELAQSVVIKGAASSDRLLDEVLLFLHAVEADLPEAQKQVIARLHGGVDALRGRKLLLVDDDLRNVFALSQPLRRQGLEVLVADNGQMALDRLDEHPDVAAVLMDMMMPVMDGFEATRRIRAQARFAQLPVIAVTARAMAEDRRKCMEAGASDYLSKPVELEALLAMLRIWIGGKA